MEKDTYKNNKFTGWKSGNNYDAMVGLFGMHQKFYKKALGDLALKPHLKVLELACGTGNLLLELHKNETAPQQSYGVDISEDQLNYARSKATKANRNIEFINMSIDELQFEDESFDLVITSMALHAVPKTVRHKAIAEAARVLKKGGQFLLVDWSKPRIGCLTLLWLPMLLLQRKDSDNWYNRFPEICKRHQLELKENNYINSVTRRQVFVK